MRNIVILNSLHFSYPLPILMRVSYNTLIVKQNTSDYYKYTNKDLIQPNIGSQNSHCKLTAYLLQRHCKRVAVLLQSSCSHTAY